MSSILIVEDEGSILMALEDDLTMAGYEVRMARDGRSGLEEATREAPEGGSRCRAVSPQPTIDASQRGSTSAPSRGAIPPRLRPKAATRGIRPTGPAAP